MMTKEQMIESQGGAVLGSSVNVECRDNQQTDSDEGTKKNGGRAGVVA